MLLLRKRTGLAEQFRLSEGEVMFSPMLVFYGQGEGSTFLNWRQAGALLGNSEQFGRYWGARRGTQRRKAGADRCREERARPKYLGMEEAACTPTRDLTCLCSKGSQGAAAPQCCL